MEDNHMLNTPNAAEDGASEAELVNCALCLGQESFRDVHQFMQRYVQSYHRCAYQVRFSVVPKSEEELPTIMACFGGILRKVLRRSDIMMQGASNEFYLLLPELVEKYKETVSERIFWQWRQSGYADRAEILYEMEEIAAEEEEAEGRRDNDEHEKIFANEAEHVVVVDDNADNLMVAGRILSKNGIHATAVKSGQALLDYMRDNTADLILLDLRMPQMDGFEALEKLRAQEREIGAEFEAPVIFLTADDDEESEVRGLTLGAIDFIKKPFIPEVLTLRVHHSIELVRLQRHLSAQVEWKTKEVEQLFLHVVQSLADAIDAKDTYTNGHSGRVAEYSRMIAARYGYTKKQQDDIYMMGLLHDVGKIGVPDAVINKPARLNDEEFEYIRNHPVMGARILKNIKEMPKLSIGARWHHERYGGGGYPDGLAGEDIPEEARIIALADAYDAMTSRRSYRESLPQATVRQEITGGSGTQFDPRFAKIMLEMIDEDKSYSMREK